MKSIALVVVATAVLFAGVRAIGEGTLDADSFQGIFQGIGRMFETIPTEQIDESRLMGRWHQMYKAAINFDVFRTQMFCPVAYCLLHCCLCTSCDFSQAESRYGQGRLHDRGGISCD